MAFSFLDWKESINDAELPNGQISPDDASCQLTIHVDANQLEDALQFILPTVGFDIAATSPRTVYSLSRNIPVKWPFDKDQDLWAYSAKWQGVGSQNRIPTPKTGPSGVYPEPGDPITIGTFTSQPLPGSPINYVLDTNNGELQPDEIISLTPFNRYEKYAITVDFRPITYSMRTNEGVKSYSDGLSADPKFEEWRRWTTWTFQPLVELLQLNGTEVQIVEGTQDNDPITNIVRPSVFGRTFANPISLVEQKGIVTCHWRNVPADFVTNVGGKIVNILKCLGTVNSNVFTGLVGNTSGYDAQTLLFCDNPEFIVKPIPLYQRLDQNGLGVNSRTRFHFPWQYDIILRWRWFDPPLRDTGNIQDPLTGKDVLFTAANLPYNLANPGSPILPPTVPRPKGHNVVPPAGQTYYVYAVRLPFGTKIDEANLFVNNFNNPPLYKQSDHREIFQYRMPV